MFYLDKKCRSGTELIFYNNNSEIEFLALIYSIKQI